jgi:hypothetical protein
VLSGDFTSTTTAVARKVTKIFNNNNKIAILKVCPYFTAFTAMDVNAAVAFDFSTNVTGTAVYLDLPTMVK